MSPLAILTATLPVYLTMLIGALIRRLGLLPKEADMGIMNLSVKVLTPCLILERIVGNPALRDGKQVLLASGIGYGLVAIGILVCYLVSPLIGLKKGDGARTFAMATGLQNYGFVAIPVIEALFGKQLIGVLFTYTLGVEVALWTVGVGLLTGLGKAPWKHAINPPVISIIIALALHYSGVGNHMPQMLHNLFGQLGACAIPLSVVLIGASISDVFGTERIRWNIAIASPILRLGILPFTILLCARWMPITDELKRILCVQAAMPSAVFTIVVARVYGGHASTAVLVVLATTIISIFTVPWMIGFGLKFVGL